MGPGRLLDGFSGEAGTFELTGLEDLRPPTRRRRLARAALWHTPLGAGKDADGNWECDGGLRSQRKGVAKEMGHQVEGELITAVIIGFISETMCK
jgi:hypothetical protein